jgi:hypothetical protein
MYLVAFVFVHQFIRVAASQILYAIDVPTQRLVTVDVQTGEVTIVGPTVGSSGQIAALEFVGSRLFGIAFNADGTFGLIEIDPLTGSASAVLIRRNGEPMPGVIEGLARDATGLVVSYSISNNCCESDWFGTLTEAGDIIDRMSIGRDVDGMSFDPVTQHILGVDRDPSLRWVDTFQLSTASGVGSIFRTPFSAILNGVNEVAVGRSGLFAVDFITKRVVEFDRNTRMIIRSVQYHPEFTLAASALKCVPELVPLSGDVTWCSGAVGEIMVTAIGIGPFSFHWRRNGINIDPLVNPTASTPSLRIHNVGVMDGGVYDCIVTNLCGTVVSNGATVAILAPCSIADLVPIGGPAPGACPDGLITGDDFNAFISAFAAGEPLADVVAIGGLPPGDGLITGDDFNAFIAAFAVGCP